MTSDTILVGGWPAIIEKHAYPGAQEYVYVVIHDFEGYKTIMRIRSIWERTVLLRVQEAKNFAP